MFRPFLILTALAAAMLVLSAGPRPELGTVNWLYDHDAALALSAKSGKPVFALFQEVPG